MTFIQKRSYLLIIAILIFVTLIHILKDFSQHKKNYILSNEDLSLFNTFLLKKNFLKIQNLNSSAEEQNIFNNYKLNILNYLLEEEKKLKNFFLKNFDFDDSKVETYITQYNRIFLRIGILSKNPISLKEDKLIEEYLETLNQRFKIKILKIANDIGLFNHNNFDFNQEKTYQIYQSRKFNKLKDKFQIFNFDFNQEKKVKNKSTSKTTTTETVTGGKETVTGGKETVTGGKETVTGLSKDQSTSKTTTTETVTDGKETVTGLSKDLLRKFNKPKDKFQNLKNWELNLIKINSTIINDYMKYFVSFIYTIIILIIFSLIKKYLTIIDNIKND